MNAVAGETGLPGKVVGTVDVREKHMFVDVAEEHANGIIAKLNRAQIKGHKVKVKVADESGSLARSGGENVPVCADRKIPGRRPRGIAQQQGPPAFRAHRHGHH